MKVVVQVTRLPLGEAVRLDPDRLGALYRQLGATAAEDVVCRANGIFVILDNDH